MTAVYDLDGTRIRSLEDFWQAVGEAVNGPGGYFGRNLDSFADCLRGGFGTPDDGDFIIDWRNHETSRRHLGYPETVRQLESRLTRAAPVNQPTIRAQLAEARTEHGPTVFDWLVEVMETEAPGTLRLG